MKDNTHFYCFTRWDVYPQWYNIIKKYFKIKNCIICKRSNTSMGDLKGSYAYLYDMCIFAVKGSKNFNETEIMKKSKNNHARFKGDNQTEGYITRFPDLIDFIDLNENRYKMKHPTQKSVEINKFFIEISSDKNSIVLDPFMGSGTTAVACKELGRQFLGFELSQEYCDIANKRLEQGNLEDWFK